MAKKSRIDSDENNLEYYKTAALFWETYAKTSGKNWQNRLKKDGSIQSMSWKGNYWDNACMEHFLETLKVKSCYNDLLKAGLLSYAKTKKLIDDFIEYYNNERIQRKLGW